MPFWLFCVILGLQMYVSCVFLGWRPQFYQNVRKPFCRHRGFQSELGAYFLRIGKLRPRSFRCVWFHLANRNIASRNRKTLSLPENTRLGAAFLKMRFPLRFKHFSGPGKLLKQSLQRCTFICASRASWKLIFDALKSWDRWLFNACRCTPQLAILLRKMAKRIGAFSGCNFSFIIVPKLQKSVPKMEFLGPINVAVNLHRHKRQNFVSN